MMTGAKQVADGIIGFFGCAPDPELKTETHTDYGNPAGNRNDAGTPVDANGRTDAGRARDAGPASDAGIQDAGAPDAGKDGGLKPEESVLERYSPPDGGRSTIDFPEPDSQGVSYFSLMEEGAPTTGSFPVSLNCNPAQASCYFGMGVKGYSFASDNLENGTDRPLTVKADFSPDIDGQTSFMAATVTSNENYYGLYDSFDPVNRPGPGVAVRDSEGAAQTTYIFPASETVTTPNTLLPLATQMWASTSNYIGGEGLFGPGKLFVLDINEDGTLMDDPAKPALTTTQFNPQLLKTWMVGEKTYVLGINTGKTDYMGATPQESVVTESGLDVIDTETFKIVANIPLGLGAANTFDVTPDGAAAFIGSQVLSNIYVVDLERLATKLEGIDPDAEGPVSVEDVTVADATNAIPINATDGAFIPAVLYHEESESLLFPSFNDGTLVQLYAGYNVLSGIGITLKPGFGAVVAQYICTAEGTQMCSAADLTDEGIVGFSGLPVSGMNANHAIMVQRQANR